jgi:hypothetical protein
MLGEKKTAGSIAGSNELFLAYDNRHLITIKNGDFTEKPPILLFMMQVKAKDTGRRLLLLLVPRKQRFCLGNCRARR